VEDNRCHRKVEIPRPVQRRKSPMVVKLRIIIIRINEINRIRRINVIRRISVIRGIISKLTGKING